MPKTVSLLPAFNHSRDMKKTILTWGLILITTFAQAAESINFHTLEVKDGLFSNPIHSILQDSYGFMWFNSKNMLSRYDGYSFKHYPMVIYENYIPMLNEDYNKNIWIRVNDRYLIYDREQDCWSEDISKALPEDTHPEDIHNLYIDHDGNIWYTLSENRLAYCNPANNGRVLFSLDEKLQWLECRNQHAYLLLNSGKVQKIDLATRRVSDLLTLPRSSYPHHKMYLDYTFNLWFYTPHSSEDPLRYYNVQSKELKTVTGPCNKAYYFVTEIIDDQKGNIWIGTDNAGIYIYNLSSKQITSIKADSENPFSIPSNHISYFYQDRENVMWVGTSKRGLAYTYLNNVSFNRQKISGVDDISCILEDHDGSIWLGSDGNGIAHIAPQGNKCTRYTGRNNDIPEDLIVCSFLDSKQRVWFGTYGGGVFYHKDGEFHPLPYSGEEGKGNPLKEVISIAEDMYGNIWMGTIIDGLYCYEADGTITTYRVEKGNMYANCITDISCRQGKDIYVATSDGLFVIDCHSREVSPYPKSEERRKELSPGSFTCLFKDSRDLMWIGKEEGLAIYSEAQDTLIQINSTNGLSHNYVRGIFEDHNQNMWITTDNGVTNVIVVNDPLAAIPTFRCYRYYDKDGLGSITFNNRSIICRQNGEMLMGGMGGYISISPTKVSAPRPSYNVKFTALYIGNKRIEVGEEVNGEVPLHKNIQLTDEITLDYSNNNFALSVSSMNYSRLHKTRFSYRLAGHTEWAKLDGNLVTFNRLQPGTYRLEVKTTDEETANNGISSLTIRIKPPFLQSPVAYRLYSLLALALMVFAYFYMRRKARINLKMQRLELEVAKQHDIDEAQMRFFTNVGHDLRTPLSLIVTPLEKLLAQDIPDAQIKEDLELMHRNAGILMDEVNQLLDLRRLDNGKSILKLSHGNITEFVKKVCQAFEPYSKKQGVKLELKLQSPGIEMAFDPKKVQRILMNLLSNAYKFNVENGTITVAVEQVKNDGNKQVSIQVADTGIGIAPENRERIFERFYQETQVTDYIGSGVGLHIVAECVKLHGGTISVTGNTPQGSVFTILLPQNEQVVAAAAQAAEEEQTEQTHVAAEEKQTDSDLPILVVEDNDDFRRFLVNCLKGHHQVIAATNGEKALAAMERQPVKLVISDIMMPVMDGLTLCNKIKGDINYSHTPVILLTAKTADEHILEGLREGADDYITKPFNIDILLLRIKKLLEWRINSHRKFSHIEIEPSEITISSLDEKLIGKAIKLVEERISDPDFSVEDLSAAIGMTRGHLYKKLMAITGTSPIEFIRTIRIKRGKQLLEKSQLGVAEIAYDIGLSPKQFAKYFKEAYGKLPSEYKKEF